MEQIIRTQFPSNIALVKYWGKRGNQLPCNASLSMTLSQAYTKIRLTLSEKKQKTPEFEYRFEGKANIPFGEKVLNYILKQPKFSGLLSESKLLIESENSFPHSTGIASSASAFASIASALLLATGKTEDGDFRQEVSRLARLGSGSASRSVYGPYALWGNLEAFAGSSDEFAVPVPEIHPVFQDMKDAIIIVEDQPKKVSSTVGHALMKNHPFAEARFKQANENCLTLLKALKEGDFNTFISITEREALTLHAMMMTSEKHYMLFQPESIEIINRVVAFREQTGLPVCFTLDAGPNIHLLYANNTEKQVLPFLENDLKGKYKKIIFDQAGRGGQINQTAIWSN